MPPSSYSGSNIIAIFAGFLGIARTFVSKMSCNCSYISPDVPVKVITIEREKNFKAVSHTVWVGLGAVIKDENNKREMNK